MQFKTNAGPREANIPCSYSRGLLLSQRFLQAKACEGNHLQRGQAVGDVLELQVLGPGMEALPSLLPREGTTPKAEPVVHRSSKASRDSCRSHDKQASKDEVRHVRLNHLSS